FRADSRDIVEMGMWLITATLAHPPRAATATSRAASAVVRLERFTCPYLTVINYRIAINNITNTFGDVNEQHAINPPARGTSSAHTTHCPVVPCGPLERVALGRLGDDDDANGVCEPGWGCRALRPVLQRRPHQPANVRLCSGPPDHRP